MTQLNIALATFSGAGEYTVGIPKKAAILDVWVSEDFVRFAFLVEASGPVLESRKFLLVPEWEGGKIIPEKAAYIGAIHWMPAPNWGMKALIVGSESMNVIDLPPGEKLFPSPERYQVFELCEQ